MYAARCFVFVGLFSVIFAATVPTEKYNSSSECDPNNADCALYPTDCSEHCACNRTQPPVEDTKPKYLLHKTVTSYITTDDSEMSVEDSIATKIQEKVEKVFRGILISALFFIVCASVCVISVVVYCCHIRCTDKKLKREINNLAKKLKIDVDKKTGAPSAKKGIEPIAESCNVTVADANIMCV